MAWITGADVLASAGCPDDITAAQAATAAGAACAFCDTWTGRNLEGATYREWKGRVGPNVLLVDNAPIRRLYRASVDAKYGLSLTNSSAGATSATVSAQDGELNLTVFGGANDGDEQLTLATYATMALLLAAIVALGKGWTGSVVYDGDPQDIRPDDTGNILNATGYLYLPDEDAEVSLVNRAAGLIFTTYGWPSGITPCFVKYDGGLATIPDDLTAITLSLACDLLRDAKRDSTLQSERLDNYAWARRADATDLRTVYRKQLQPWRRESIPDVDDGRGY